MLARLGGEEFVVLLPGTALKEAAELANRLRSRVERDLADVDGKRVPATIRLGCATLTDDADKLDGLLDLADRALYQAKRLGRNRVEISEPGRPEMDCMSAAAVLPVSGVC